MISTEIEWAGRDNEASARYGRGMALAIATGDVATVRNTATKVLRSGLPNLALVALLSVAETWDAEISARRATLGGPAGAREADLQRVLTLFETQAEPLLPSRIADALSLSRPAVTRLLTDLRSKGLIEVMTNERDQRSRPYRLSESGRANRGSVAPIESERRWIVSDIALVPEADRTEHLRQGYLISTEAFQVRVRVTEESASLTVKAPAHGEHRQEFENGIPMEQAEQLLLACGEHVVVKDRHWLTDTTPGGRQRRWSVDVFGGRLAPLILAEYECPPDDNSSLAAPAWCMREVTSDPAFHNDQLALHGLPHRLSGMVR